VLAAFWIQFMTHDWFSHMKEGVNDTSKFMAVGCTEADAARYGCRPGDRIDAGLVKQDGPPETFKDGKGREYLTRAPKTMANNNTAWWDGSQIYGYDETSLQRVRRDPADKARLLLVTDGASGERFLPQLQASDPMLPDWASQESTGFPDNYTVGISFLTNVFAREHNSFVDAFRKQAAATPNADCGLRNPKAPKVKVAYKDVTDDELFDIARLVVSAEIAKIHTTEWTPQLLYDEPLFVGMNGNWNGLVGAQSVLLKRILRDIVLREGGNPSETRANQWYSVFASGAGITGLGSQKKYDPTTAASLNAGVNHFGSAFNFPEEFITVYRLHSLVPDLLELRRHSQPNVVAQKVPVVETFRAKSFRALRDNGMADWGLTLGRQRLGALVLGNTPQFLQNLPLQRLQEPGSGQIDIAALDLIRDREHGVPRFNEFRRQYGLRSLTSFDDFIAPSATGDVLARQQKFVAEMRDIYGQHKCSEALEISRAQKRNGKYITDCLGKPDGAMVDNVEDLDTVIGWLAEPVRPHGFAISETQLVVFILNASRRLFSDRFLTSGFRKEFYTTMGVDWVNHNGPGPEQMEPVEVNGHRVPVAPMKRLLMRNVPELRDELAHVINSFDPWARDRGKYYSLEWSPRPDATADSAFSRK